ncbi:MAG: N-acetyltransferase [Syntrophales bacterium]|jgi:amino-acid N-acetyltransferase|nr:N-acetyltransferase [Syntrophales bacterium]MCK9527158.1 N-acetyltransferase [Syntrophales bacterium]MDX9921717.1 N-acetyltransferase [Syntrophales bacterium]
MLRKAKISDVKDIHKMINESAIRGEMLPRSLMELYGYLRDYFVYCPDDGSTVVGVCAMHIFWENLAEVRSLFVLPEYRRRGIATKLVEACVSDAITLDLYRVFTLTNQEHFFKRIGFVDVEKTALPEKIWTECIKCPKYPDYCDEIPLIIEP